MSFVVDENVLVVANARNTHVGDACILACIDFLLQCEEAENVVLDDVYEILALYATKCNHSGNPGVGDYFFVWLRNNIAKLRRVKLDRDPDGAFSILPEILQGFDSDDHIYVATALTSGDDTAIANAVDSDYIEDSDAFDSVGLEVEELCPQELRVRRSG